MFSADILWTQPAAWGEIQSALDHHLQVYAGHISVLASLAEAIADRLQALEPVLDDVCAVTCPQCSDPCCLHADVRYDFRDLLYLHCRQEGLPLHQPKLATGRPCSFLARDGCVLPRSLRPFLCTWYLCPWQMNMMQASAPADMIVLLTGLQTLKKLRKDMDREFMELVLPESRDET